MEPMSAEITWLPKELYKYSMCSNESLNIILSAFYAFYDITCFPMHSVTTVYALWASRVMNSEDMFSIDNNWLIVYFLWCYTKCHIIASQCMPNSLGHWRQFSVSTEHSRVCLVQKTVSTEFTQATKESLQKLSVNRAHLVNEGNFGWNQC